MHNSRHVYKNQRSILRDHGNLPMPRAFRLSAVVSLGILEWLDLRPLLRAPHPVCRNRRMNFSKNSRFAFKVIIVLSANNCNFIHIFEFTVVPGFKFRELAGEQHPEPGSQTISAGTVLLQHCLQETIQYAQIGMRNIPCHVNSDCLLYRWVLV